MYCTYVYANFAVESELVTLQQLLQCAQEERDSLSGKCEGMTTKLSQVEKSNHDLTLECGCLRAEVADLRANLEEGECSMRDYSIRPDSQC